MAPRRGRPCAEGAIEVREGRFEDVLDIVPRLNPEDVAECVAWTGMQPHDAVLSSYTESLEVWTGVVDGRPEAMAGVLPGPEEDTAEVWLMTTPAMLRRPKALTRALLPRVRKLLRKYGHLHGYVDDRHARRKRWLELLGFRMTDHVETSDPPLRLPFRLFVA